MHPRSPTRLTSITFPTSSLDSLHHLLPLPIVNPHFISPPHSPALEPPPLPPALLHHVCTHLRTHIRNRCSMVLDSGLSINFSSCSIYTCKHLIATYLELSRFLLNPSLSSPHCRFLPLWLHLFVPSSLSPPLSPFDLPTPFSLFALSISPPHCLHALSIEMIPCIPLASSASSNTCSFAWSLTCISTSFTPSSRPPHLLLYPCEYGAGICVCQACSLCS